MVEGRKESEFAKDVDRVLSGQESKADNASDKEYRGNLDFSKKIADTRSTPSPAFQSALKSRLLSKLAEAETAIETRKRTSLWDSLTGLFRQRTWQAAGVTVAVLVVALVVVWRAGLFSQGPVVTSPYPTVAVEATVRIDKETYIIGENVKVNFTFFNKSSETLLFVVPPAFRIEALNANIIRSFSAGELTVTLTPDVATSYSVIWDQTDDTGIQVPAGEYQIVIPNVKLGDIGFLSLSQSPTIVISDR